MKSISLRKASLDDCEEIFKWRNAEETRKYFHDAKPIEWERHVEWFHNILNNGNRHLLLGEEAGNVFGVLRYDVFDATANVSVYLVPGMYGKGRGTSMLNEGTKWIKENLPFVNKIVAEILSENQASRKAFMKAGFVEEPSKNYLLYTYSFNESP